MPTGRNRGVVRDVLVSGRAPSCLVLSPESPSPNVPNSVGSETKQIRSHKIIPEESVHDGADGLVKAFLLNTPPDLRLLRRSLHKPPHMSSTCCDGAISGLDLEALFIGQEPRPSGVGGEGRLPVRDPAVWPPRRLTDGRGRGRQRSSGLLQSGLDGRFLGCGESRRTERFVFIERR